MTEASGAVDFYLYAHSMMEDLPELMTGARVHVEWPADWTVSEVTVFGVGSATIDGQAMVIDVFEPAAPFVGDELVPVALIQAQVDGFGEMSCVDYGDSWIEFDGYPITPLLTSGQAGVECAYCWVDCDHDYPARPVPDPVLIETALELGDQASFEVDVVVGSLGPVFLDLEPTVTWLTADAVETEMSHFTVTITVDATGLPLGWQEGFVQMTAGCVGCTKVRLNVMPPVATETRSWSSMKALFR